MQIEYNKWLSLSAKEQHKILDSIDRSRKDGYATRNEGDKGSSKRERSRAVKRRVV